MPIKQTSSMRCTTFLGSCLVVGLLLTSTKAEPAKKVEPTKALSIGQESQGPWWMQQTALSKTGGLNLKAKPWWARATKLKQGESFLLKGPNQTEGRMLVRRETTKLRSGKSIDAIVWIIDDDADGSLASGGDRDSDCYVVDYRGDGTVDRMLDWIDDDGDNEPDEMDIRYFVDGELRYAWFGTDLDDDGAMWSLAGYEYGGPSFFEADPYGNSMIYMNKLDTEKGTWSPISECPFAFYDTDDDGLSEVVVRCSGVPIRYDTDIDPDFANDYRRFQEPWRKELRHMGIVNIRYSFDIDDQSNHSTPLHYDMGFNLVGSSPYDFPGMHHVNTKRRAPQTTVVTPFEKLRSIADTYVAKETGFTWHENFDDTVAIGYADRSKDDFRWEGVFWCWERRFMENTGGPCKRWNCRREWCRKTTETRRVYYSGVDHRIHLFGAEEAWIPVGHFSGLKDLGEIRIFDTDRNGYFDRWEYRLVDADGNRSEHIVTVRNERAESLPWNYEKITRFYVDRVLPQAVAANDKVMAALQKALPYDPPSGLKKAMATGPPSYRRYAQDIVRELHYQKFRRYYSDKADRVFANQKQDDLRSISREKRQTTVNSHTAWMMVRALQQLDVLYGQGEYEKAVPWIERIQRLPQ